MEKSWDYYGWYFNDKAVGTDKIVTDKNVCPTGNNINELIPEEIIYYIYAVLYSNVYRKKYAEFLKMDFPRVPFTKDYKVFSKIAER